MSDKIVLPYKLPRFSTYNYIAACGIAASNNKDLDNFYFNNSIQMRCRKDLFNGFSTPNLQICETDLWVMPFVEKIFLRNINVLYKGCVSKLIENAITNGYYIMFNNIDDYYIKGKTWYKKRHFKHDGLICLCYNKNRPKKGDYKKKNRPLLG